MKLRAARHKEDEVEVPAARRRRPPAWSAPAARAASSSDVAGSDECGVERSESLRDRAESRVRATSLKRQTQRLFTARYYSYLPDMLFRAFKTRVQRTSNCIVICVVTERFTSRSASTPQASKGGAAGRGGRFGVGLRSLSLRCIWLRTSALSSESEPFSEAHSSGVTLPARPRCLLCRTLTLISGGGCESS